MEGKVVEFDSDARTVKIATEKGVQTLHADRWSDRHIAYGYVKTAFSAQGRTAERAIIISRKLEQNLVNQSSFYVQNFAGARTHDGCYRRCGALAEAIAGRHGQKMTAIDANAGLPPSAAAPSEPAAEPTRLGAVLRRLFGASGDGAEQVSDATTATAPHKERDFFGRSDAGIKR